jgi:hypothetical protein
MYLSDNEAAVDHNGDRTVRPLIFRQILIRAGCVIISIGLQKPASHSLVSAPNQLLVTM